MPRADRWIPFARPCITEQDRSRVAAVLSGDKLTQGPCCAEFENAFRQSLSADCYCLSTNSCMAALQMAYLALGIGPGDEVIVPAMTHVATVHAVELAGARPVFVDCDATTGNLHAADIERAVTPRTKAIGLVHFLGLPCPMREILTLARRHGLSIVEDCALALGARLEGRHVGLFGDAGCFSFYPCKHITTGEGGMFVTTRRDLADTARRARSFGVERNPVPENGGVMYDVPALGSNYRMTEMAACLGMGQMTRADSMLARRRANFEGLAARLAGLEGIEVIGKDQVQSGGAAYCLSVLLPEPSRPMRNEILLNLKQQGVEASVYYPHPIPGFTYYRNKYGCDRSLYPHATRIADGSIALPVGPHLDDHDIPYIADALRTAIREATS